MKLVMVTGPEECPKSILVDKLERFTCNLADFMVVITGRIGTERMAKDWALKNRRAVRIHHERLGEGPTTALAESDFLVAFVDEDDDRTNDIVATAKRAKKPVRIVHI